MTERIFICCTCGEECLTCVRDLSPQLSPRQPVSLCCHGHFYEQELKDDEEAQDDEAD